MVPPIAAWLFVAASSVVAIPSSQPTHDPAGLCAGDRAFQELLEQVMSLRLAGGRSVSEVLAVVPDAERQLRQMVLEGHHRSEPRRRVDGTVEVDAWLPTPSRWHRPSREVQGSLFDLIQDC